MARQHCRLLNSFSRYLSVETAQGGGIGTLIIFISIVLVAAIAAYVLLGTASTLQSRSLLVGKESTARVATQLQTETIYGIANDTSPLTRDHGIETLVMTVKISAGSDPVDMEMVQLHFATADVLISRIDLNHSINDTTGGKNCYADYYYNELNGNGDDLLESGESFEIHFYVEDRKLMRTVGNETVCGYAIPESMEFEFTMRPAQGTEVAIVSKVPSMLTKNVTRLYP